MSAPVLAPTLTLTLISVLTPCAVPAPMLNLTFVLTPCAGPGPVLNLTPCAGPGPGPCADCDPCADPDAGHDLCVDPDLHADPLHCPRPCTEPDFCAVLASALAPSSLLDLVITGSLLVLEQVHISWLKCPRDPHKSTLLLGFPVHCCTLAVPCTLTLSGLHLGPCPWTCLFRSQWLWPKCPILHTELSMFPQCGIVSPNLGLTFH